MSFFVPAARAVATRCVSGFGARCCQPRNALQKQDVVFTLPARFKAGAARGFQLKNAGRKRGTAEEGEAAVRGGTGPTIDAAQKGGLGGDAQRGPKRKLLWPGIWTLLALTSTYGTLAYLDVKAGIPSSDGSHLPARAQLPQTLSLTPTALGAGLAAHWRDLDGLTTGVLLLSVAIHLLKRAPLPLWRNFVHGPGSAQWTAFTHPLLNASWTHLAANMAALVCFLPDAVHYLDGDLFHASALLASVSLVSSYLTHSAYRLNLAVAPILLVGPSSAIAAAFGVCCVAYAREEVWGPAGAVFGVHQAYAVLRASRGGRGAALLVRCVVGVSRVLLTVRRFI